MPVMRRVYYFTSVTISLCFITFAVSSCLPDGSIDGGNTPLQPVQGGYGFTPGGGSRGNSVSTEDTNEKQIKANEGRWGTHAMIDEDSINQYALEDFRLGEPTSLDDLDLVSLYADFSQVDGRPYYEGKATISYKNLPTNTIHYAQFDAGRGDDARYNVWVSKGQNQYYHGFFQDTLGQGSLVLVLDSMTTVMQDADSSERIDYYWSGSVWFMNFHTNYHARKSCKNKDENYIGHTTNSFLNVNSLTKKCWFISIGPFDCRTWRKNNGVDTFRTIEPDGRCYTKLGTFEGLNIKRAFKVDSMSELAKNYK